MKKKKNIFSSLLFCAATLPVAAQNDFNYNEDSQFRPQTNRKVNTDSLGSDKEIPKGIRVWTVDERFGDTKAAVVDTLQHMYMNSTFTEGLRGEYNTLGNMGTARLNRIFIDRRNTQGNFIFTEPYDYIVNPVSDFHFTNTYSPITNITLNSCGDKVTGEDDFKAIFAVNANKRLGAVSDSTTSMAEDIITPRVPATLNTPCGHLTWATAIRHISSSVPIMRR